MKILVKISGSIAAYKSANLVSKLIQAGHQVKVAVTKSALDFIGKSTLAGLTGDLVYSDESQGSMDHIDLSRWADLVILCPATANRINKMAAGLADDLVSTLFLSHDFSKPYLVAPAMNTLMLNHPTTRASLKKLSEMGVQVLPTQSGLLACGEVGEGRLLDIEKIYLTIQKSLVANNLNKRILITSGGTEEALDDVRVISNKSTGKLGAFLAEHFYLQGAEVTLVASEKAQKTMANVTTKLFTDFNSLREILKSELAASPYDVIIHAAAVSDFSPLESVNGKISSQQEFHVQLKKNPKIISWLKDYSMNKSLKVIGFKLTSGADGNEAVVKLLLESKPDLVIHNDWNQLKTGQYRATLWNKEGPLGQVEGYKQLAVGLQDWIEVKDSSFILRNTENKDVKLINEGVVQ